ncbi:MAG: hypothetical protein GF375_03505 [Candidatus Omnitrophica bacterium]|nr:hypothetical protein [Candidatus Omnitrophota bacterium]
MIEIAQSLVLSFLLGLGVGKVLFAAKTEADRGGSEMGLFAIGSIVVFAFLIAYITGMPDALVNGFIGLFMLAGLCTGHYHNRMLNGAE